MNKTLINTIVLKKEWCQGKPFTMDQLVRRATNSGNGSMLEDLRNSERYYWNIETHKPAAIIQDRDPRIPFIHVEKVGSLFVLTPVTPKTISPSEMRLYQMVKNGKSKSPKHICYALETAEFLGDKLLEIELVADVIW